MAQLFRSEVTITPRLTEQQAESIRERATMIMDIEETRVSLAIPEQFVSEALQSGPINERKERSHMAKDKDLFTKIREGHKKRGDGPFNPRDTPAWKQDEDAPEKPRRKAPSAAGAAY
jgi:hypothetical protein